MVIGLAAGGILGFYFARNKSSHARQDILVALNLIKEEKAALSSANQFYVKNIEELKWDLQQGHHKIVELSSKFTAAETEKGNLSLKLIENKKELEELHHKLLEQFTIISGKVLRENAQEFSFRSHEKLSAILDPLKEKLQNFEQKVQDTYEKNLKGHTSLTHLIENLRDLNQQIGVDAKNLTLALKGEKKTQGNWGENILEKLLERSGLEIGVHYRREVALPDENRKYSRPDVVIDLPGNKHIIIDSKVSLNAYEACFNSENEDFKEIKLKEHLQCMKSHIQTLSAKQYENLAGLNTPDFVLMFIPIEPAFNLAMQHDSNLFLFALDRNIVLVTNSTLLATLKTVASIWKQESQKMNVLEIAEESGKLYDKFVGFVSDMQGIGNHLENSKKCYDAAFNKLKDGRGNLVSRAEKIKKLGAKAGKSLDLEMVQKSMEE